MKEQVLKLYLAGKKVTEIAKLLNKSKAAISYHIRDVKHLQVIAKEDLKIQAKVLRAKGLTIKSIAIELKVSTTTVKNYISYIKPEKQTDKEASLKTIQRVKCRRRVIKETLVANLGSACLVCGYNKCITALEFHHLDPKQKDFTISGGGKSLKAMLEEASKCILVCANCHREIHAGVTPPPDTRLKE